MEKIQYIILFLFAIETIAQEKVILIYNLLDNSVDSITNIPFDTTKLSDKTDYYLGNFNSFVQPLEQVPPTNNIYPNSQFTYKKRAADDYDLTKYPLRTNVKIFSINNGILNSNCTGSLISKKHILTAAHCVCDINTNNLRVDSLRACPVYNNGNTNANFMCSAVEKIYLFKNWNLNGKDFSVLELAEPLGETNGWISIGFNRVDSILKEGIYYKFTYPATTILSIDSNQYNGDTLYYNYGKADVVNNNIIGITSASGIPGESGSSLIKIENNQTYTSYGVLSFSTNLMHSKFDNWEYYSIEHIIHNDLTSINSKVLQDDIFIIYPNPSNGKIRINNIDNSKEIELTIIDYLGKIVVTKTIDNTSLDIDISHLPNGFYMMKIVANRLQFARKIIINKN